VLQQIIQIEHHIVLTESLHQIPLSGKQFANADDFFGLEAASQVAARSTAAIHLRIQPVDATHWLNRSAGVSKPNVFLGRSFSLRATAFSCA